MAWGPLLQVENLGKTYADGWTLHGVTFTVERAEIVGILGPSGSGKTTLLRLLAGLEIPDSGRALMDGEDVTHEPPHRRSIGLMFQEYALFPHRDVFGNVAFGLQMQARNRDDIAARVTDTLELVGLAGYERRDVNQLSGGERQRVALARSLAPGPKLLMLDEPLGALDRTLRERLVEELPQILQDAGVTAITVTHDQEEAFAISDRLILMRDGRVAQVGTPEAVYQRPASTWVARFLGLTNLLSAKALSDGIVQTRLGVLKVGGTASGTGNAPASLQLLVRPEAARLDADGPNVLTGVVRDRSFRGGFYRLVVEFPGGPNLVFAVPSATAVPAPDESIALSLDPRGMALLPAD
jgi:ABC-type Fe3+/spermidine/putrescine transport system ATPase subunit